MMDQEKGKYEKVLEILRRTNPVMSNPDEIEEKVLSRVLEKQQPGTELYDLIDFLFGWTYVTWVRRILITASVFLVIMFVFQQGILMRQINHLSRQIDSYESEASGVPGEYSDRRMMLLRFSEKRYPFFKKASSDKQVEELFRTIDRLKKEYKELDILIKEDPELKKLIEKKLSEIDGNKIKI